MFALNTLVNASVQIHAGKLATFQFSKESFQRVLPVQFLPSTL